MYTCGLTVYARGHIGNFRTFVALDVLRRALEFEGYAVSQVATTPTSTIARSSSRSKAGRPLRELHAAVRRGVREDAAALGLEPVEYAPRATDDHIPRWPG